MNEDVPGVIAPPPLIFGIALIAGIALGRGGTIGKGSLCARIGGAGAALAGLALGAATLRELRRAGTNARPDRPATALVTSGPFSFSRNPAYLGAASMYIGAALVTGSLPALAFLPVALVVIERGVVEREERYLGDRFGDAYRAYAARIPRWF